MNILKDNVIYILILFIAFASFGLGRMSIQQQANRQGIIQTTFEVPKQNEERVTFNEEKRIGQGTLVASVSGTKYHFPWCSGAQRIKDSNKIWFDSAEEARAGGYTPAANCKGLK